MDRIIFLLLVGMSIVVLVGIVKVERQLQITSVYSFSQQPLPSPIASVSLTPFTNRSLPAFSTSGWISYMNKKYHYSFKYPPLWSVQRTQGNAINPNADIVQLGFLTNQKPSTFTITSGFQGVDAAVNSSATYHVRIGGKPFVEMLFTASGISTLIVLYPDDPAFPAFHSITITLPPKTALFDQVLSTFAFTN